jgi:hypothetical protein
MSLVGSAVRPNDVQQRRTGEGRSVDQPGKLRTADPTKPVQFGWYGRLGRMFWDQTLAVPQDQIRRPLVRLE